MSVERSVFGSDRPLLYDVEPWNRLGFGVANFGDNIGTLSQPIFKLADEIGKSQLLIMTHIDAQRQQPPSVNTVERVGKLINRVHQVLVGRMKDYPEKRIEGGHSTADVRLWQVHPVPYFTSATVRNNWLSEYNRLVMIALTNMYQHSDNNVMLTVTKAFATCVWQYFNEIKLLMGTELLGLSPEVVKDENFLFVQEHYDNYHPDEITTNYESLDTPGPLFSRSTEDDLRPLFVGYPANLIIPNLKQYPVDPNQLGLSGQPLPEEASAVGTGADEESATAPAGATIGQPQV